ncbi:PHA/PHB synthase family protein [Deefgea salmonis]|uniref:Class I poly(R)-hydroxyalkanoic acid synthase n=1 Tax=Deefgea salmonis TaxID=2875502 RepID=A0ABS8BGI0_9NEIS|nr:class I poly(R)-hydroxyalkanoic acid synthase [Deefgea salmonis]MCB5194807.1 class I poly(R)-hydroxyalkanoic acid synthase [Deefgea salmonis]
MDNFFQQITEAHRQWTQNWVNSQPNAESVDSMHAMNDLAQKMSPVHCAWLGSQSQFYQQQLDLWLGLIGAKPAAKVAETEKNDRRFNSPEWDAPLFDYIRQNYLVTSKWLLDMVGAANSDEASKEKAAFFTRQYLDAMSPTNFAFTNPEVMKLALETKGESLQEGMKKLMADMQKGAITMTDESQFAIGENLAMTPGEVIFENELFQLIQYTPTTAKVYSRPLLIIPPCVNKYYIMDLQPANSMVAYVVSQGYSTFLMSWKSIEANQGHLQWDDYIESGVIKATEVVRAISKAEKINALSFCIGGELLTTAMPVLQARGLDWFESITLMTVMLDHTDPGEIKHFIDWNLIRQRESQVEGVIDGKELAKTFSALRSNDLIWNYVVNNYLKGKNPPPFDLLYWNSDSANLSLPMHTFFLRNMYLENNLTKPNSFSLCGTPIDLTSIKVPAYIFAAREDHIVPWHSAYLSNRILQGPKRFVLGASGHIAGAINPVSTNKRNYWVNENTDQDADTWLEQAESHPGSWWQDWSAWLAPQSGSQIAAAKKLGNAQFKMIEAAPGRYVKARVV